jgi:tetratricopeptide (TPR) repeat protein
MTTELDPNEIVANIAIKSASSIFQRLGFWFKKAYLKAGPINFNVLLSISYEPGTITETYYKEVSKNLKHFLSNAGLSDQLTINDLSGTVKFETKEKAELLRQTKNIDLIVWGEFTNNQLKKNGKNLSELKLSFTYGHPDDPTKRMRSMIDLELKSRFAVKNYWSIFEENSFDDIKLVSENAAYMSVYIIALTLKLFGRIEKSLTLFQHLYDELLKKGDPFSNYLKPHLINCYDLIIFDSLWNKKKYIKGKECCNKFLELVPNNYHALSSLALLEYKLGYTEEARQIVANLNKSHPDKPVTLLDNAFFYILQRKYKKAYECYRKVIKIKNAQSGFNSELLLEFFGEEYDSSNEPALLYASGIVAYYFSGNTGLSEIDLKKFLSLADVDKYKYMINHANRVLGLLGVTA